VDVVIYYMESHYHTRQSGMIFQSYTKDETSGNASSSIAGSHDRQL
jgi:hypothetical protein